jgi:cell division protein FtsZ
MEGSHGRTRVRIRVVGAGGAGSRALNRMIAAAVKDVELVAVNTDLQALERCHAVLKINVGLELTRGLGSGGDWTKGRNAATESLVQLNQVVKGADLLFITAGMGGGTGTGASGVIAEVAKAEGALTVGVVTRPFRWEGKSRNQTAEAGIGVLHEKVDALIVIPNDQLTHVVDRRVTLEEAFKIADDVLRQGVQSIADLIVNPGVVSLEFADLKTVMTGTGECRMGIGFGAGDNRAENAAGQAVGSPLLGRSIDDARRILVNITGGEDMTAQECETAAGIVRAAAPKAHIIYGAATDARMCGEARVTLVATGFPRRLPLDQEPTWPSGVPSSPRPRIDDKGATAWLEHEPGSGASRRWASREAPDCSGYRAPSS